MSKKLMSILIGAGVVALGVLIMLAGIISHYVLNVVIAVLLMVGGAGCLAFGVYGLIKDKKLEFNVCLGAFAGIWLGLILILEYLDIFSIVGLVFLVVPAVGLAMLVHGIYMICKKETVPGVIKAVIGAVAATVGILYVFVPSFQDIFWIIAGVLVALFGVYLIVMAFVKKEEAK